MIKFIAGKLGYIHKSELTEQFLLNEVSKMVGDPVEMSDNKDLEDEMFKDLSKIDGLSLYLTSMMAKDMQRVFASSYDQAQLIHGAFARTSYFKSRLKEEKDNIVKKKSTKLNNLRYKD